MTDADNFDKLKDACRGSPYERMLHGVTDAAKDGGRSEFSSAGKSIGTS